MRPRVEHGGVGRQVGVAAHPSLPQPFKWHRTELNPFLCPQWQQEGSEPIVSGLVSFLFALGSSATSQWLKKAGKSFPGTWHWDGPQSFCRALVGRLLLSSQQQAVATGYHWPWALPPSWLHFPTERGFYRTFSEGKRQATPAQKCRGGKRAKGTLAWGCLFMRTLNNSFLSLLSSSQRDKNKRVFLAYCLELRIVKREENITVTEGDTRKRVTFNCSTYNQSHQIKALYIFLNNLWLGSGYERTRTPAIAMQREAC